MQLAPGNRPGCWYRELSEAVSLEAKRLARRCPRLQAEDQAAKELEPYANDERNRSRRAVSPSSQSQADKSETADDQQWSLSRKARTQASKAGRSASADAQKGQRVRRTHPATSDATYSDMEREFIKAVDAFKSATGGRFPSLTELLRIAESIGFHAPGQCFCHHYDAL